jgi:hypothetical protein
VAPLALTVRAPVREPLSVQLTCDSCGAEVPADDMNLSTLTAKCRRCDSVFSFGGRLAGGFAPPPRRRPPLPSGLKVESGAPALPSEPTYRTAPAIDPGPLVITRRWFRFLHLYTLFFAIVWNAILAAWYQSALAGDAPLETLVFPILHVAVGVGLAYSSIAGLINRTVIRVAGGMLTIRHAPLPWRGRRSVPVVDLRQLYVRRRVHRGKNGAYTTWDLLADTKDDSTVKLLSGSSDREQAEYIEWAIEQHLGIEDDPRYAEAT